MVEVFKTNVKNAVLADEITDLLHNHFPDYNINFDLDDCDNILRIESDFIDVNGVLQLLSKKEIYCEVLEDIVINKQELITENI